MPSKLVKVELSTNQAEAEMKLAVSDDSTLMVDESSKCSDDVAVKLESSEEDGCIREADSTDRRETSCTSSDGTRRKRGRPRKSGS